MSVENIPVTDQMISVPCIYCEGTEEESVTLTQNSKLKTQNSKLPSYP